MAESELCTACNGTGLKDNQTLCPVCGGTPDPKERAKLKASDSKSGDDTPVVSEADKSSDGDNAPAETEKAKEEPSAPEEEAPAVVEESPKK